MAARGSVAKENLIERFKNALGEDYVGTEDGKKFFFWSDENGERIQVAITMTVPKTPLASTSVMTEFAADSVSAPKAEMGEDEKATLDRLMKELGL